MWVVYCTVQLQERGACPMYSVRCARTLTTHAEGTGKDPLALITTWPKKGPLNFGVFYRLCHLVGFAYNSTVASATLFVTVCKKSVFLVMKIENCVLKSFFPNLIFEILLSVQIGKDSVSGFYSTLSL